jgi:hypothetical protein
MTRRNCIIGLLLAAFALGIGVFVIPQRGIGPASFQCIRSGMRLHEVESAIGLPNGDYFTRPESFDSCTPFWGRREHGGEPVDHLRTRTTTVAGKKVSVRFWRGNDYYIHVAFDENDSAVAWSLHERLAAGEWPFIECIRSWFW